MGLAQMTGVAGQLRIANRVAADLGAWSMVPGAVPGTKIIRAQCVSADRFLMAQGPEVIILTVGTQPLRWRLDALQNGGDTITATVSVRL